MHTRGRAVAIVWLATIAMAPLFAVPMAWAVPSTPSSTMRTSSHEAGRSEVALPRPPGPFPSVRVSLVTIDAPLPSSVVGVPPACQRLRYDRYRAVGGPDDPERADAVFVAMPGVLAGAGSLEMQALEVVQDAADAGRHVEVWALDRRANCLEDRTGLDAAEAARDPQVAIDYYLRGTPLDGRTFAGFMPSSALPFLAAFDLRQTLEDYRTVIVDGIPDPSVRTRKVFCGGHSLGGLLTGLLMSWDFDGNSATTADAGYNLCAGSIALDSTVTAGSTPLDDPDHPAPTDAAAAFRARLYQTTTDWVDANFRLVDVGVIGPETMTLLEGVGLNADLRPDDDTAPLVAQVPTTGAAELALRAFYSASAADAFAPVARLRRQHLSGDALLGAFMDDNSQYLPFIQASFGSFDRGPVTPRTFPFGGPSLLVPTSESVHYGWRNFDEPLPDLRRSDTNQPYTSSASEMTDVRDLARALHAGPLDFLEAYFPTRLITDVVFAQAGFRNGDLARIRYPDAARVKPRLTISAGDSGLPFGALAPSIGDAPNVHLTLAGFNHLDVITAAPRLNDGSAQPGAAATASFMTDEARRRAIDAGGRGRSATP